MNKKTVSIVVIVVAIIVIILIAVGVNIKTAKAPVGSSTSTTAASATSTATTSPVTITTHIGTPAKESYGNSSFSFGYPSSWTISNNSPLTLTNFGNKYLSGGVIPDNGGVINVVTTTLYGSLQNIINFDLQGATNITTTTLMVDGISCPAAADQSTYVPGHTSRDVSVYCLRGTELWKLYLSYADSGTSVAANLTDFNGILASMKFLP